MQQIEYIQRQHDLEGLIRQNQLLRLANRKLTKLCSSLIETCSSTLHNCLPSLPPFHPQTNNITHLSQLFQSYLQEYLTNSTKIQEFVYSKQLQQQRQNCLKLQEKILQYQTTVSEMALIIQKLELQVDQNRHEVDHFKHLLARERVSKQKIEQNQVKWRSRYYIIKSQIDIGNDDGDMVNKSRSIF